MSNWREQLGGEEETKALADWVVEAYHYPVLLAVVVFAFWNRFRNYSDFIIDGDILYGGNDPWYHARSTEYVIQNFPETMPFDPWTNFPFGTASSQFGTLFDQLIALAALVVGLGDPSQSTSQFVLLVAPAVFGALVCLPSYVVGRRLGGRFGGIVSVLFVALAPDSLLTESIAGNPDHQVAEALFMAFAVLGLMVALRAAERELPVHELLLERDLGLIRETLGWSLLAGVALGAYMWVWPPAVWLYGIFGVFFAVHMSAEHIRGRSPEHTAFVGVITFTTAGLLQLGTVQVVGLSATSRSLLQPGFGFVAALGVAALAVLSHEVYRRDISPLAYPASIGGSAVAVAVLTALFLPGLFAFFVDQFERSFGATLNWLDPVVWFSDIGLDQGAASTIGEGTPGDLDDIRNSYQFATFTALLGGMIIVARQVLDDRPRGEELLLVVVAIFMVTATFTQVRFSYYLTLVIGGLNAALVGYVVQLAGTPDSDALPETYQVLTIVVIVFVMFVPLLGVPLVGGNQTAVGLADDASQPGSVTGWDDSLDWMANNTPEPGTYDNPDGEPLEYYGNYDRTDDFEYPDGSYGVLSWWDYGHWITGEGERVANANPFQQNVDPAATFLLAQEESEALDILEQNFSDGENATTRYVMVDALMAETDTSVRGKFFAPADFHPDFERGDFYRIMTTDTSIAAVSQKQPYYESMLTRLYHYHGSEQRPEPFVTRWTGDDSSRTPGGDSVVGVPENTTETPILEFYDNVSAAQEAAANDPTAQVGGIGANPAERVPALEHFRLVYSDEVPAVPNTGGDNGALSDAVDNGLNTGSAFVDFQRNFPLLNNGVNTTVGENASNAEKLDFLYDTTPSFTKTFERVPGATIEGSLPENATDHELLNVTAGDELSLSVPINPQNGENFTYSQTVTLDENLTFEATVPYSTTGYDEWGTDEGYTNVSARASGPYTIETARRFDQNNSEFVWFGADVDVTEGQVIGEEEPTVTVELEEQTQDFNIDLGGGG